MRRAVFAFIMLVSSYHQASAADPISLKIADGQKGVGETMVPEIGQGGFRNLSQRG